ncbi:hypothetical protein ORD22_15035, partial [Sporosarcina sp. GW1-11]|nr:hypothetical protein [Sporosarcina sp. GW1-11]
ELYFEGHAAKRLAEEHGIKNRRRILEWVEIVRRTGTFDSLKDRRGHANAGQSRTRTLPLEKENERLRMEIHYLKKLMELKGR